MAVLEEVSPNPGWQRLLLPFRYKFVFLDQGSPDWTKISRLLETRKRGPPYPRSPGVGVFIRRLELYTAVWTARQHTIAIRLLEGCPKTQNQDSYGGIGRKRDGRRGRTSPRCTSHLFEAFDKTSYTLLSLPSRPFIRKDCFASTPQFTHLGSLSVRFREFSYGAGPRLGLGVVILPNLHSLEIVSFEPSDFLDTLREWSLPSLRCLSIRHPQAVESAKLLAFFAVHGAQLGDLGDRFALGRG